MLSTGAVSGWRPELTILAAISAVSPDSVAGGLLEHSATPPGNSRVRLYRQPIAHVPGAGPVARSASTTKSRYGVTSTGRAAATTQTVQLALALSAATL